MRANLAIRRMRQRDDRKERVLNPTFRQRFNALQAVLVPRAEQILILT